MSRIGSQYNIAAAIVRKAESLNLNAMGTGGNIDYIYKGLGGNADGSPRIAILSSDEGGGSPESLKEEAKVLVILDEEWIDHIVIRFPSAKAAIEALAEIDVSAY